MDDRRPSADGDRRLDRWLHQEGHVPAPDRLIEDVFARTTEMSQVGRRSWLPRFGRAQPARRSASSLAFGVVALVVVGLGLVAVGGPLGGSAGQPSSTATATPAPTNATPPPTVPPLLGGSVVPLVAERTHETCSLRGPLTILPAIGTIPASAWVACGADAQEIVLGTSAVVDRPGLGTIAADAGHEWAIRGDSVVRLNPDRTIAGTVRIGTPGALAVSGTTVWVLDVHTGTVTSIGTMKAGATSTLSPSGRPVAIAIAGGSLWVLDQSAEQLLRLDLTTGQMLSAVPVQPGATQLVQAAGALYVTSLVARSIVRVDPVTENSTTMLLDTGSDVNLDALGGSSDDLLLGSRTTVYRLDPVTGALGPGLKGTGYIVGVGLAGSTAVVLSEGGILSEVALP